MDEKLLGKCGFYCGACPTYIKGGCRGCEQEHTTGDCFTRDFNVVIGWMPIDKLEDVIIYPEFLKKKIFELDSPPEHFVSR